MRDIRDPLDKWLSAPPLALNSGNKRPVTLPDSLTVLLNSGPVIVDVLANDFDPEGQSLTLQSVYGSLGAAELTGDDRVQYTPPAGLSGFDTVVYTVTDDLGQQSTGQINVTIVEPELSILTTSENTLIINAEDGQLDITVTNPAKFAGTYQVSTTDLLGGPVNLVPPGFSGTIAAGQTLTASPGLWVYDLTSGVPAQSWQWRVGGTDVSGATATSYVVDAADLGLGISVAEIQSDTAGQRVATSATLGAAFQPSDDTELVGWWDADDNATLTITGGVVQDWTNKAGAAPFTQGHGPERPATGIRTLNGRNVLEFDGNKWMEHALDVPASGNIAFHMALVIDGTFSAFAAALSVDAANDFQIDANNASAFDGRLNMTGIGTTTNLSGGPFAGALILSAVFDRTGAGQAEVYVSNTLRGQTAYSTSIDASALMRLMTNRSANANIDGAIAEVIVTADVSNRAQHHNYLAEKWGLI